MAAEPTPFPIVGIGASAGGLKAIEELLINLPPNTGMAYIIVQHLSRRFKSLMQEILAKDTRMTVKLAEHGMHVEPDHIYLIPPAYELTIQQRVLYLEPIPIDRASHFVVDTLLDSLAQDLGDQAIAVILSGTGSDGSRGILNVKNHGGIVFAQDPNSGEFDGMPRSAIDTRIVDYILPPKGIAEKLSQLAQLAPGRIQEELKREESSIPHNPELIHVLRLIQKHHSVDFTLYKSNTVLRRIEKHMSLHGHHEYESYYLMLSENPVVLENLYRDLLIGVTEFFRDKGAYEELSKLAFPQLLLDDRSAEDLRIWVCGCSTGEEVYSLAIQLHEFVIAHNKAPRFTILATDVNEQALAHASRGSYSPNYLKSFPTNLLERYFEFDGKQYQIRSFVRDNIIFARNDATADPPFINLDLISCRNMLIYIEPAVQERILLNFHFGLKKDGILWLGPSENILDLRTHFASVSEKWKIFQSKGETPKSRKIFDLKRSFRRQIQKGASATSQVAFQTPTTQYQRSKFSFGKLLIDKYAPTCALFDREFNLLFLSGGAGRYLRMPDMDLHQDLLSMTSKAMGLILRDAVSRIAEESGALQYTGISQSDESADPQIMDVRVDQIDFDPHYPIYVVEWLSITEDDATPTSVLQIDSRVEDSDAYAIIQDLHNELGMARQEIQTNLEELETSNEELQASNEELLAANEELQSTNEELQSVNEELYTVNAELQSRNRELTEANSTIDNLLGTSVFGTLFLDKELRIKLYTPLFSEIIQLNESDIGNGIQKFQINWKYPSFFKDLNEILISGKRIEREIEGGAPKRNFRLTMQPFMSNRKMDGVVINLMDITDQKEAESQLKRVEAQQRLVLDFVPFIITIADAEGVIRYSNRMASDQAEGIILGQSLFDLVSPSHRAYTQAQFRHILDQQHSQSFEIELSFDDQSFSRYQMILVPISQNHQPSTEVLVACLNISEEKIIQASEYEQFQILKQILRNPKLIVSVKDEEYSYVFANKGFANLLNKPQEMISGINDFALFSQDVASQLRKNDERVLQEFQEQVIMEYYNRQDEQTKGMTLKFPIEDPNGGHRVAQISIIQPDQEIDDVNPDEVQQELQRLIDERTESWMATNAELRTITRSMAHDLRAPLRAIHTYGELLEFNIQDQLGDENKSYLDSLLRQSHRMGQILDGLLSYVKLGGIDVRKEWIDMKLVALEIWEDLKGFQEEPAPKLIIRDCPPVWTDLMLVKQIISNLFGNAIKYQHPDRPCEVEFGAYQDHPGRITYFCRDNGIGFDLKDGERIFQVFERLHEARNVEGSGIGLSIVKKSMERLGGQVRASSVLGEYAEFFLEFPTKSSTLNFS
ncbi:chemotaxis protein CheB [Pontibacter sp. G13]|uniref:chemotaxis protein CheB n=1 Tax=Pontibacter sp. G13 TaxID=3074898 RepID=UPI00288C61D0|nr:chemotaxis protein CheB [Pontibacter sp. G13]WNJ21103.1 chemotaxis protein CheB [Pontibacter sp. G13]